MSSLNMSLLPNSVFLYALVLLSLGNPVLTVGLYECYIFHNCTTESSFAPNSTYQLNLRSLLSSLSSNTSNPTGFYNTSITTGGRNISDATVYGLFMCRGDISPEICRDCVMKASDQLISLCNFKKDALIWYKKCLVRYSDRFFFSTMDEKPGRHSSKKDEYAGDENIFDSTRRSFMDDLIIQAANIPAGCKKFAVREAEIPGDDDRMYGLAQCTPDLSNDNCSRCLKDASKEFDKCCSGKIGARVVYPSCIIRYELYRFYEIVGPLPGKRKNLLITIIMIVVAVVVTLVLCSFGCYFIRRKVKKNHKAILKDNFGDEITKELESLQFEFETIEAATNHFSDKNVIGEGGFGAVYKGILCDDQEIAVKRLSKLSEQGANEFKNEVLLIAKLQHKNLVKLIGFCLKDQEKILVYEYVSNKSLNYFLFDTHEERQLSWFDRFNIIKGVARGILYLHEDSRLKIIHRDLKPSNILLDDNLNPKIADFGMARIVSTDRIEESTCRVVGTFGYMAPEYISHGQFSIKSDVFSFGVMILEIVSGKRNACSHQSHLEEDLLTYAWLQWKDKRAFELLDPVLEGCYSKMEAFKCIQIGLLCVQENADDRPTMTTINLMLNSDSLYLPLPQEPAYFTGFRRSMPDMSLKELDISQSTGYSILMSTEEV